MRKILFMKPYGVTQGKRTYWRALVDGYPVEGEHAYVWNVYLKGKQAHAKAQRDAKKAKEA